MGRTKAMRPIMYVREGLDLNQVLDLENHAPDGVVVTLIDRGADLAQAKGLERLALVGLVANRALDLRQAQRFLCLSHY